MALNENAEGTAEEQFNGFDWDQTDENPLDIMSQVETAEIAEEEIVEGATPKPKPTTTKIEKPFEDLEEEEVNDNVINFGEEGEEVVVEEEEEVVNEEGDVDKKTTPKPKGIKPASPVLEDDKKFFTSLAKDLQEKGIFTQEIAEDAEIDEEAFFELHDKEIEAGINDAVEGIIEELKGDDDAAALIKYVKSGGKTHDFLAAYKPLSSNSFPEDFDLDDVKNQKKIIKHYRMTVEGESEEEANEAIEWLETKDKVEDTAKKLHTKILANDKQVKANLQKQLEDRNKERLEKQKLFSSTLQTTLDEVEEVGKFKFSAVDKKSLVGAITKATVKVGDKMATPLQVKLNEAYNDPKKLLVLTKFLLDDMDVTDVVKKAKTDTVKAVQSKVAALGRESKSGSKAIKKTYLSDNF